MIIMIMMMMMMMIIIIIITIMIIILLCRYVCVTDEKREIDTVLLVWVAQYVISPIYRTIHIFTSSKI